MTTRYTTVPDIFSPEKIGNTIKDYTVANLGLFQSAAVKDVGVDFSGGGSSVRVPVYSGFATDPANLDTTNSTATPDSDIQYVSMTYEDKAVTRKVLTIGMNGSAMFDAYNSGNFNLVGEVMEQATKAFLRLVDKSLIAAAAGTDLSHDISAVGTGVANVADVINAKAKWGDTMNDGSVLVCSAKVFADLLVENKAVQLYGSGVAVPGATGNLPVIAGMPVIVSDNIVKESGDKYTNLIVKMGGIGFSWKRDVSYKALPQVGDKTIHEFVAEWVAYLLRENGKKSAVKFITK